MRIDSYDRRILEVLQQQLREHARRGEFPVTEVAQVSWVIGPQTAGPDYVPGA